MVVDMSSVAIMMQIMGQAKVEREVQVRLHRQSLSQLQLQWRQMPPSLIRWWC